MGKWFIVGNIIERHFNLTANNTDLKTEVIAGTSTYLTMVYIIAVNPGVLSQAGMDFGSVFVATCLAAAFGSAVMGLVANYPVALAPGMGLNAFFTYGVVMGMGHTWEVALGCVFWSGIIFLVLSVFRIREWIINAIPISLKTGISVGIGLFLAIISLQNAGVIVANTNTLVQLGNVTGPEAALFLAGLVIIIALYQRKVAGAVIVGILTTTLTGVLLGIVEFAGIVSAPPSINPTFLRMDLTGALDLAVLAVIFTFLFVDLFDTSGTLIAVADKGGLLDREGRLPRLGRALISDSSASIAGSLLGTSTTTSYIESGVGIAAGGRTGLTAITVSILFLLSLFFSPLISIVPGYATASALMFISILMISTIARVDWNDLTEFAPLVITAIMMPLTFSISDGIAVGFISYLSIKLATGKYKEVNVSIYIIAVLSLLKLVITT